MDTNTKFLVGCTAALIATMAICTYVLYNKLDDIWTQTISIAVHLEPKRH